MQSTPPVPPPTLFLSPLSRRGLPSASAPSRSGLRPGSYACGCSSPDQAGHVLASLTSFVKFLAAGRVSTTCTYVVLKQCPADGLAKTHMHGQHDNLVPAGKKKKKKKKKKNFTGNPSLWLPWGHVEKWGRKLEGWRREKAADRRPRSARMVGWTNPQSGGRRPGSGQST